MNRSRQPYHTAWMFVNRAHADQVFFEMLQKAMENTPLFRNKQLFFQYTIFLYLSGSRRIEPFLKPTTIQKINDNSNNVFFKVIHLNAKHFGTSRIRCTICNTEFASTKKLRTHQVEAQHKGYVNIGSRRLLSSIFFSFDVFERALFEYLLQGRMQTTIDFSALLPAAARGTFEEGFPHDINKLEAALPNIDKKFKMFKTDITDGSEIIKNSPITPHMLRHLRAFDLIAVHGTPPHLVQRLLGWDSRDMVDRYADINGFVNDAETLAMWRPVIDASKDTIMSHLNNTNHLQQHPVEQ